MYRFRQDNFQPYYGYPYPTGPMQGNSHPGWNQQPMTPYDQFQKPIQPQQIASFYPGNPQMYAAGPQQNSSFINYFYDEHGQMDYGKVITTVSQVANAFQQVTPVVQQINSLIQSFRT